ncbi:MAG: hypothetical protein IAF38_04995 [Bacteroidia bacterium]|nr:hypothetical protein [Bacteroidia bacterium]
MKRQLFLFFIAFYTLGIFSQVKDVSGLWKGFLTQPSNYGITTKYPLWLTIVQKGDSLSGFEKIEGPDPSFYGILPIVGTIKNELLVYVNTNVKEESEASIKSGYRWYLRKVLISITVEKNELKGKWQYPVKNPTDFGEIILTKQVFKYIDPETGIAYFN